MQSIPDFVGTIKDTTFTVEPNRYRNGSLAVEVTYTDEAGQTAGDDILSVNPVTHGLEVHENGFWAPTKASTKQSIEAMIEGKICHYDKDVKPKDGYVYVVFDNDVEALATENAGID